MPETKLKPCPFCGGKAYYRTPTHLKGTAFDVMTVECKQCGASPYAVEVYENDTEEIRQLLSFGTGGRMPNDETSQGHYTRKIRILLKRVQQTDN